MPTYVAADPNPSPSSPMSSGKKWLIAGGVAIVALLGIGAMANAGEKDDDAAQPVVTTTSASPATTTTSTTSATTTTTSPPTTLAPPTTTPPPPPTAPAPTAPKVVAPAVVMPNVVCMNLQDAQDLIQEAGVFFSRSHDATGADRNQMVDSNWQVVSQSPSPGTPIGELEADLGAVKYGEPSPC